MNHAAGAAKGGHEELGHVVPVSTLLGTCIALMVLTWITVSVTHFQLGYFNIWIALIIATIKATLVCLYFMHLRWDRPFNSIVLISSVFFMLLFLGGALTDTGAYNHEIEWKESAFRTHQDASSPAPPAGAATASAPGAAVPAAAHSDSPSPATAPVIPAPH